LKKQYRDVQASTSKIVPGPSSTYDGFDDMDENTCEFSLYTVYASHYLRKIEGGFSQCGLAKESVTLGQGRRQFSPLAQ